MSPGSGSARPGTEEQDARDLETVVVVPSSTFDLVQASGPIGRVMSLARTSISPGPFRTAAKTSSRFARGGWGLQTGRCQAGGPKGLLLTRPRASRPTQSRGHGTTMRWGVMQGGLGPHAPRSAVGMAPEAAIVLPTQRTPRRHAVPCPRLCVGMGGTRPLAGKLFLRRSLAASLRRALEPERSPEARGETGAESVEHPQREPISGR